MRVYVGTEEDWWCEMGDRQVGVYIFTDKDLVLFLDDDGAQSTRVENTNGVTLILEEWDG